MQTIFNIQDEMQREEHKSSLLSCLTSNPLQGLCSLL